jgi:hypothetical protein
MKITLTRLCEEESNQGGAASPHFNLDQVAQALPTPLR